MRPHTGMQQHIDAQGVVRTAREFGSGRYRPGEAVARSRQGDVVLIHGPGWLGRSIRFFQRRRHRDPGDVPFAYWSHAALVVTPAGHLVEAGPRGVVFNRLEAYRHCDYHYVHLDLSDEQRLKVMQYAYSCVSQKYGRLGFCLFAIALLLGDRFRVRDHGQQACGALIVRALERAGLTFERTPADTMPADLAKRFGVRP
jgi:hypothetical protein